MLQEDVQSGEERSGSNSGIDRANDVKGNDYIQQLLYLYIGLRVWEGGIRV